jgi:low affinity Fe/Cu permease
MPSSTVTLIISPLADDRGLARMLRQDPTLGEDDRLMHNRSLFARFAKWTAHATGQPHTFVGAVVIILLWVTTGPLFGFSDTWQLVINTGTTIVTFLMVFLIQNTQNRESEAMQLKLDELIRAVEGAHNALLDLEELEAEDLDRIRDRYQALANAARVSLSQGEVDTGSPRVRTD